MFFLHACFKEQLSPNVLRMYSIFYYICQTLRHLISFLFQWKQALSFFCMEEYATMTVAYSCCEHSGASRWLCFDGALSKPNYRPTPDYTAPMLPEEPGFTFDASAC